MEDNEFDTSIFHEFSWKITPTIQKLYLPISCKNLYCTLKNLYEWRWQLCAHWNQFWKLASSNLSIYYIPGTNPNQPYTIDVLAVHALAPLALSAARREQCRFVSEMIA